MPREKREFLKALVLLMKEMDGTRGCWASLLRACAVVLAHGRTKKDL